MMREFQELVWQKSRELYREMPWREDTRPYYVLVSELMLQQTQVVRVVPKFQAFIERFPDAETLAGASLADTLKLWQGLGYNRRAKFLHEAAKMIVRDFGGKFPEDEAGLLKLPGVGKNTAGAILAYSYNQSSIFIETNIRTVYIHHFFADDFAVDDKEIIEKLAATLDHEHPREFYWALMDYGSWLKANGVRNNSSSKHYKKQSPLKGSLRETRGAIVRLLSGQDMTRDELQKAVAMPDRFDRALEGLQSDGLIAETGSRLHLTK
jgi:A/G-specific adenine glycosylase